MRAFPIIVTAAMLSVFSVSGAQPMRGPGGPGQPAARMYDPKTVETVQATVKSLDVFKSRGMADGVHLAVTTAKETIAVHLGPTWYLDHQDIQLAPGDNVIVRGSRVQFQGKPAIIAATVTRGEDILELRDERGFPRWIGWRRR